MIKASTAVMAFAISTGRSLENNPYRNQRIVPVVKMIYMYNEMPEVSFVLIVLIACGKKEIVVQNAAANPAIEIQFIIMIDAVSIKIS